MENYLLKHLLGDSNKLVINFIAAQWSVVCAATFTWATEKEIPTNASYYS